MQVNSIDKEQSKQEENNFLFWILSILVDAMLHVQRSMYTVTGYANSRDTHRSYTRN